MTSRILIPKIVMAWKSERGYHTFNCPGCEQRNKTHEKRALNYINPDPTGGERGGFKGEHLHFVCVGCHREVHVSRCPAGGLIVL